MWALIISAIGNFLGGPFIRAALTAYQDKLANENTVVTEKSALAQQALALQAREDELNTQYKIATVGAWYAPDHLMGYAVAVYFGKLLVWDKVFAMGATDPLGGWAAFTSNLIVGFYFGKAGIENVLKIWKLR